MEINMRMPVISIIMPSYNRANKIPIAIQSILNQTYTDWELIIVDDGSKDATCSVVEQYLNDKRIRYLRLKKNSGVAKARNEGIKNARGEFIAFLDSDDEWVREHLERTMNIFAKEDASISMSLWLSEKNGVLEAIDQIGNGPIYYREVIETLKPRIEEEYYVFKKGIFEYAAIDYFYFYHINTLVFRKSLLKGKSAFDESLHNAEDSEFIIRLLSGRDLIFINKHHSIYHQSKDGIYSFIEHSNSNIDEIKNMNKECIEKVITLEKNKICAKFKILPYYRVEKAIMSRFDFEKYIYEYISKKYVFLVYICSECFKKESELFMDKALENCKDSVEKRFLAHIFDGYKKNGVLEKIDVGHMNYW